MPKPLSRHAAALVTPFAPDGTLDETSLRRLARFTAAIPGIGTLVVNANAGEVDALTLDERNRVLRIVVEEVRGGAAVIAGLAPFPSSNAGAVAGAHAIREAGADAILLLGPAAFARGIESHPEVVEEYTREVAAAAAVPVIYFVQGVASGVRYTPALVKRICAIEGVAGYKDTSWSAEGFEANASAVRSLSRAVRVITGNDNSLLHNFITGSDGTLLVLHLLLGERVVQMDEAVERGDLAGARYLEAEQREFVRALFAPPMLLMATRFKHLLARLGIIDSDRTRAPIPPISGDEAKRLDALFEPFRPTIAAN